MALQQVELLPVLTGLLLLVLVKVQGWERINESQLIQFYETGQWSDPVSFTADDYYDYEDEILKEAINFAANETSPVVALPRFDRLEPVHLFSTDEDLDYDDYKDESRDEEVEGFAPSEVASPRSNHMEERDSSRNKWPKFKESEFHVEFVAPLPKTWVGCSDPASEEMHVVCTEDGFRITLPSGKLSNIQVVGWKNISVMDAPKSCGYHTNHLKNVLTVDFTGCNVREDEEDLYSLQLSFRVSGRRQELTVFCVESTKFDSGLLPRTFGKHTRCDKPINPPPATAHPKPSRCAARKIKGLLTTGKPVTAAPKSWIFTTKPPATTDKPVTSPAAKEMYSSATSQKRPNCAVHVEERISCGHYGTSRSDCEKKGCCMDSSKHGCYYPLDECTADEHAVFAIRHNFAAIPVDPRKLSITGGPLCRPAIVNDKVAVFKIKLEDCGVHSYEVGDMKIYMIEVQNVVKALNLKYGMITRDEPLRFLIECRYMKDGGAVAEQAVASFGYMVKTSTPNLPSSITSSGRYSELRIAKDRSYSSYYPTYHQPLKLLLGHPVYLELSLRSAKPDAVLLVNYCLAYPRSAKNALVMIHEGCANPNDPAVSILKVSELPQNRHLRRFTVEAFQFMDQRTNLYLNEQIYFMCSTEVCMTLEKPCVERCFDGKPGSFK